MSPRFQGQFRVELQSWFAEPGELAVPVWGSLPVLVDAVHGCSGFESDFPTDVSQIVPPLKYLPRDTSLILCGTPNDG